MTGAYVHRPAVMAPPYKVTLDEVQAAVSARWPTDPRLPTWLGRILATGVQTRYWMAPPECVFGWPGRSDPSVRIGLADHYLAVMADLMSTAARAALRHAGIGAADVDGLVVASMSGWTWPGADALLVAQLGLQATVRRITTTQAACAGGAWALQRAGELVGGSPGLDRVLVVCCDPLSFYLHPDDTNDGPMIFRGLLGDAAAAAVVTAAPPQTGAAVRLEASYEQIQPGDPTDPVVGVRLETDGWHFVSTSRLLPAVAAGGPALRDWWGPERPAWTATHSGGPAVLTRLAAALDLPDELLAPARASLRDHGNCGGASLLDALARSFDHPRPGRAGLLWAVGPGFTTHALKARWVNGQRPVTTARAKGS